MDIPLFFALIVRNDLEGRKSIRVHNLFQERFLRLNSNDGKRVVTETGIPFAFCRFNLGNYLPQYLCFTAKQDSVIQSPRSLSQVQVQV